MEIVFGSVKRTAITSVGTPHYVGDQGNTPSSGRKERRTKSAWSLVYDPAAALIARTRAEGSGSSLQRELAMGSTAT